MRKEITQPFKKVLNILKMLKKKIQDLKMMLLDYQNYYSRKVLVIHAFQESVKEVVTQGDQKNKLICGFQEI